MSEPCMDMDQLQLWGGIECTVNRVGDTYRDQLVDNGHAEREDDIEQLCALGISAVRYPVLWERITSDQSHPRDWESARWHWPTARLEQLREGQVESIIGLVHHGSGPRHTSLVDEGFVLGLREYAEQVARRFPWVTAYTPVNEPLTTARFSCLYGHWYPHLRSDDSFVVALVLQCLATAESMRAIRSVNSEAKLVLTEDLGKTHSTPSLSEQAEFENQRRWLSIDLLMGRVTSQHPLYDYLARTRQLERWLGQLADNPMPPDLLGFNYYLTSERHLDERLESFPVWTHGGNGRQRYADVEAVRVLPNGIDGREKLLADAWQRYGLPMAVTEVHLCGAVEEQMLWLREAWTGAHELRAQGIDMRAVTVWSLFGSYDWNSLCTCRNDHYEPGAFDVRSGKLVRTPLADYIQQLANGRCLSELPVDTAGWWRCDSRLHYRIAASHAQGTDWPTYANLPEETLYSAASALMEE